MSFLRDALLVATKDLRIERRSRIALQQIIPFGGVVVMLFAFALDSDRTLLHQAAPDEAQDLRLARGEAPG